jgi:hypothetical protein
MLEINKRQGLVRLEGLGQLKKFIDFIGSRNGDLPAFSVVPEPAKLPVNFSLLFKLDIKYN